MKEKGQSPPRKKFLYEGAILAFGNLISPNFTAQTLAVSEKQARNNFTYQAKRKCGLAQSVRIELAGRITQVN